MAAVTREHSRSLTCPRYVSGTHITYCSQVVYLKRSYMVEAAGVEPASENVTGQETTCLFTFMPRAFNAVADASPRTFAASAQNGQETGAASLKS